MPNTTFKGACARHEGMYTSMREGWARAWASKPVRIGRTKAQPGISTLTCNLLLLHTKQAGGITLVMNANSNLNLHDAPQCSRHAS